MNFAKLNPWNWLKKEEEQGKSPALKAPSRTSREVAGVENQFLPMRQFFDSFFRDFPWQPGFAGQDAENWLRPKLDISGDQDGYSITLEAPGVDEKDLSLEQHQNTLIIRGEKKRESEREDKGYYHLERSYGSFQRLLSLPEDADLEKISAKYKNGVISITIPRKQSQAAQGKRIALSLE